MEFLVYLISILLILNWLVCSYVVLSNRNQQREFIKKQIKFLDRQELYMTKSAEEYLYRTKCDDK